MLLLVIVAFFVAAWRALELTRKRYGR